MKRKPKVEIVFASDCPPCPDCGEPWCEKHKMHYADCECIGPNSEEAEAILTKPKKKKSQ